MGERSKTAATNPRLIYFIIDRSRLSLEDRLSAGSTGKNKSLSQVPHINWLV